MKKFGSKQLIPLAMALMGIVFAFIGFTQLGFWDKEPQPGFFPSIIAIVMVITSIAAFFQTLKEEDQPKYNKDELMVIAGGAAVIAGSFIVGMNPDDFSVCTVLADCDRERNPDSSYCNYRSNRGSNRAWCIRRLASGSVPMGTI